MPNPEDPTCSRCSRGSPQGRPLRRNVTPRRFQNTGPRTYARRVLRWCAYCLRFLGERAPFHDYAATHGLCTSCERREALSDAAAVARVKPIAAFHARLLAAATGLSGRVELPAPSAAIEEGRALGIPPLDLLMGVLQPVLYEIGRLWDADALAPETEARFTSFCESVLDEVVLEQRRRLAPAAGRPVFLVAAAENRHTVGIRILGFAMREGGQDVRVVTNPVDAAWLVHLATLLEPTMIGISIARPEQLGYAIDVLRHVGRLALDVRVVVGGFGVAGIAPAAMPPGLERMTRDELSIAEPRS